MSEIDPLRSAERGRWWLHRPRVDELFRNRPLVHLVAPAGYGKSMAASQWAESWPAGSVAQPGLRGGPSAGGALLTNLPADLVSAVTRSYGAQDVLADGGEELQALPAVRPGLLILDDLDLVPLSSRTSLLELAEQWVLTDPAHHQLVVISRTSLPAGMVDTQLTRRFIGPTDLAFDREEVDACISQWARPLVPGMNAATLHRITGGWPVALSAAEDGVPAGAVDDAWFPFDRYLQMEILDQLPGAARSQFLGCWPLDELDEGIWQAIDDDAEPVVSFDHLAHVVPLVHTWAPDGRHVRALPEIVRQRLECMAGDFPASATGERMVRYWLQHDRLDQAAIVAGRFGSWEQIVPVLREHCAPLALRDFHREVIDLLQPFPTEVIAANPDLGYWLALALLSKARLGDGETLLHVIDQLGTDSATALGTGRRHVLQMLAHIFRGDAAEARRLAEAASQTLPPDAWQERFRALATADVLAQHAGETDVADRNFADLLLVRDHLPADQRWWYTFVVPNRADWLLKTGRMHEAEQILLHQLRSSPDHAAGILRVRLSVIALEQGEPDRAATWLTEAGAAARASYWWLEAALTSVRVLCARGDFATAAEDLYAIIADRNRFRNPVEVFRPQLMLADLWIQEGQLALAETWLDLASRSLDAWPRTFGHPIPGMVRASLAMARQSWEEALHLLAPLADEGRRRNQGGVLVQILAHIALAQAELGQADAARATVTQAVEAAQGGLYVASFQVAGLNIRDFLVRDPLLVIRGRRHAAQQLTVLSERELEVLEMVATGMSNSEIADRLYISRYTVKNHLARIYTRLGVGSRQEAVSIATRMGLLTPPDV